MSQELLSYLLSFVSEHKRNLFRQVIAARTRYLTLVLEDIYQPHNASATLRSADCFGIQDVHIIENQNSYNVNPEVALGASKWLTLYRYNQEAHNTANALRKLKAAGYRIIATTPHHEDVCLEEFDLAKGPTAFVFGAELRGLSQVALDYADGYMRIPMVGFTESLNISVAVATTMHHLTWKLRKSELPWQLSPKEQQEVLLQWAEKALKRGDLIVKDFWEKKNRMQDR